MKHIDSLADITEDILIVCDNTGKIITHNNHIDKIAHFSDFENISEILTDYQNNLLFYYITESINQQKPQKLELQINHSIYNINLYPSGNNIAVCLSNIDQEYQLRQSLYETLYRLDFASKIAKMGYWELDLTTRKLSWSKEMFRLFGIKSEENKVNRNIIKKIIHKQDWPKYKEKLHQLVRNGKAIEGVVRLLNTDKKIIYCRYKADIIHNEYSKKIMGTFQDITELMEIQQTLEKAKKTVELINKNKTDFLAQTSHDMQQPMSALSLFIENLLEANLDNRQQILVGKIYDSAISLQSFLNSLLDVSKIEQNELSLKKEKIILQSIFEKLFSNYEKIAQEKNIQIKIVNTSEIIYSDSFLLERLLNNYVNNAIKYSKNKILLGIKRYKNHKYICVVDNGSGILKQEQKFIFNEYYQGKNHQEGSGLGLYIVKKIANILRLEVGVKSKIKKGSCFYIKI